MIVVDTSVLVAIIREEDEAALYTDIIDEAEAIMSVVSYVETQLVVAGRRLDANPKEVELTAHDLGIEIVDVTRDQAEAAVGAFLRYGKGRHRARLNLADCFTYALAKSRGIPLLFKGEDFARTDLISANPL
ncbi:MAG: type II toxin-antitoxin system VapC family toxin [Xanthobacteraceae bacterium]